MDQIYENVTQLTALEAVAGYGSLPFERGWLSMLPKLPIPVVVIGAVALYCAICCSLRFKHEKAMRRRFNYPDRASMARMTDDDAQAILQYIITYEFPFLYLKAFQFALFKTYAFPTVSTLLVKTNAFFDASSAPKRYEDTSIIFAEFFLNPPASARSLNAVARMNNLHYPYVKAGRISNADLLYTLAASVIEPIRWMKLYEWRQLNEMEVCAAGTFWKSLGDAMGIEYKGFLARAEGGWADGIEFVEDVTAWAKSYEMEAMRPHEDNRKLADALLGLLFFYVPGPIRSFALQIMTALMGDRVREAFMYEEPGISAAFVAYAALGIRRLATRYFFLPRLSPVKDFSQPDPHTGRIHHYGYLVDPYYNKPTVWSRWGPMAVLKRLFGAKVPGDAGEAMLPDGFLPTDLGPQNQMGKGLENLQVEVARIQKTRLSNCPFSRFA